MRLFVAAVAGCLLLVLPTAAPAATKTIVVTSSGGVRALGAFQPPQNPSYARARAVFGPASSIRRIGGEACDAGWRRHALLIKFSTFGGGDDACRFGSAQYAYVRGRGSRAAWRTTKGLRIGDSTGRLRALYPGARRRGNRYALVTGSFIGHRVDWLVAATSGGRVVELRMFIGAAGD